jgi:hypothetical protein
MTSSRPPPAELHSTFCEEVRYLLHTMPADGTDAPKRRRPSHEAALFLSVSAALLSKETRPIPPPPGGGGGGETTGGKVAYALLCVCFGTALTGHVTAASGQA